MPSFIAHWSACMVVVYLALTLSRPTRRRYLACMDQHGVVTGVEVDRNVEEHVVTMLDTVVDMLSGHLASVPIGASYSREEPDRTGE